MGLLKYKGYSGSVDYSEEDNCLYGKVQGLRKATITYEGETVSELKADFEGAIDDYLAYCKGNDVTPEKPYSGKLNLRMTPDLHSRVAAFSLNTGITINEFINKAIVNELKHELSNEVNI